MARIKTLISLKRAVKEKKKLDLLEHEMELAQKVQCSMLTPLSELQNVTGFDIGLNYIPQNRKVSGDYYSVEMDRDSALNIFIADASGHGLQAALRTTQVDVLNRETGSYADPSEKILNMNSLLVERLGHSNYFTAFAVRIIGSGVSYSSAGHTHQLIVSAEGKFEKLRTKGVLFGATMYKGYSSKKTELGEKDILLLFTDGIFEQFSPEGALLGEDDFYAIVKEVVKSSTDMKMQALVDEIVKRVMSFVGNNAMNDDITLIAVRRT